VITPLAPRADHRLPADVRAIAGFAGNTADPAGKRTESRSFLAFGTSGSSGGSVLPVPGVPGFRTKSHCAPGNARTEEPKRPNSRIASDTALERPNASPQAAVSF
jgi:hypothetical protein